MSLQVDHLVVVAPTLAAGVQWCEATLGVTPGPGGRHALMGTHNRLARLASPRFPQAYLEIIAIDPDAPPPARARWFEIDRRAGHPGAGEVKLVHWVMATVDLSALRERFLENEQDPGPAIAAARQSEQGPLQWRITVRDDGALLCGGALPTLIEWQSAHPTERMAASGLVLLSLSLRGLPRGVSEPLAGAGVEITEGPGPAICAKIDTPIGHVTLTSD